MGFDNGSGFVPQLGGGGGGGSITWTDFEVGYGIAGTNVVSSPDFTYNPAFKEGFRVGFDGNSYMFISSDAPYVTLGDIFDLVSGQKITIQNAPDFGRTDIGDINGIAGRQNYISIDSSGGNYSINLATKDATIGSESNLDTNVTGQFSLGILYGIPVITSSLGVYNTINNSDTGDTALVGTGDLTALGGSSEAAIMAHFGGDNSQAYVYTDTKMGSPFIESTVVDSTGAIKMVGTQNPTSWEMLGSVNGNGIEINDAATPEVNIYGSGGRVGTFNWISHPQVIIGDVDSHGSGTYINVDDSLGVVIITNVNAYANDAAATGAGLTTGSLYKTTVAGSTFLKIVP